MIIHLFTRILLQPKWLIPLLCCWVAVTDSWSQTGAWTTYVGPEIVSIMAIDSQGHKWFAHSNQGVWKYDGTNVTHYTTANSGLSADYITGIAIDTQGNKWFSTNNHICKLEGTRWTTYPLPLGTFATCIYIDAQNNKWVGTFNSVHKFDGTNWTSYWASQIYVSVSVTSIAVDAQGILWVGSFGNVSKFDGTNATSHGLGTLGGSGATVKITIDAQDHKWFTVQNQGVVKFDGTTWTTYNTTNSNLPSNRATSLAIDRQGTKWITTEKGLALFNDTTWRIYRRFNSGIPDDAVFAVCIDGQGNKWIGGNNGVSKFDGTNWVYHSLTNSNLPVDSYFEARALAIDSQGHKWFGTTKFNDTTWFRYHASNSNLTNINVTDIAIDRQGNRWFGLDSTGVAMFDGTRWSHYNPSNSGLTTGVIHCIAIDSQNNKWFGTNIGIFKFDGNIWTHYQELNSGLRSNHVTALATDAHGNKWIGFYQYGIQKFDDVNWTLYNCATTALCSSITSIKMDAQGNKWFSSALDGVSKFDGTRWTHYGPSNSGLSDSQVTSMTVDRSGSLWFGSYRSGLFKFDGTNWFHYTNANSDLRNNYIVQLAMDKIGHIWILQSRYAYKLNPKCLAALQIAVVVAKNDSLKPMTLSTLSNPTTILTGTRDNMVRHGVLNAFGKYVQDWFRIDTISIKRKSLAVEGLPELDGNDAFQMNLVVTDHPNATRSVPQLLAMDVNGDTRIDTLDIAAVIERSLNPQTGFKQGQGDTVAWRYLPQSDLTTRSRYRLSATFPNNDSIGISRHHLPSIDSLFPLDTSYRMGCDTLAMKVLGIFLGDADGNYFDIGTAAKGAFADTTIFFDGLRATQIGRDTFQVPIYSNQKMFGFGIKIENYTNPIQILSISNGAGVKSYSKVTEPSKRVMMAAYSTNGNGIAPNTPLCYVTVKTNCPFPSQFGTMTAYLNGKKVNTQVTWNLCTPTDERFQNASVTLYPNPTSQQLTIDYNPIVKQLSIVNTLGQSLKTLKINDLGRMDVDVSELPNGVYFLKINEKEMKKFVKM